MVEASCAWCHKQFFTTRFRGHGSWDVAAEEAVRFTRTSRSMSTGLERPIEQVMTQRLTQVEAVRKLTPWPTGRRVCSELCMKKAKKQEAANLDKMELGGELFDSLNKRRVILATLSSRRGSTADSMLPNMLTLSPTGQQAANWQFNSLVSRLGSGSVEPQVRGDHLGFLRVSILEARQLEVRQVDFAQDAVVHVYNPVCVVTFGGEQRITGCVKANLTPTWDEELLFDVHLADLPEIPAPRMVASRAEQVLERFEEAIKEERAREQLRRAKTLRRARRNNFFLAAPREYPRKYDSSGVPNFEDAGSAALLEMGLPLPERADVPATLHLCVLHRDLDKPSGHRVLGRTELPLELVFRRRFQPKEAERTRLEDGEASADSKLLEGKQVKLSLLRDLGGRGVYHSSGSLMVSVRTDESADFREKSQQHGLSTAVASSVASVVTSPALLRSGAGVGLHKSLGTAAVAAANQNQSVAPSAGVLMSVRGPVLLSPPRAMKSPARYGLSSRRNDDWGMGLAGAGATSTASVTPFAGSPATTPGGDTGAELVRPGGEWVLRLSGWDSSNTRKTNRKQSTGVPRSNTPISGRMSVQDEWRIRRLLTYYIDKGQDDMARDAVRKLEKMGAAIDRETLDRLDELQGWGAPEPPSPPRHLMTPVMLSEVAAEYRESLIDLL